MGGTGREKTHRLSQFQRSPEMIVLGLVVGGRKAPGDLGKRAVK